MGQYTVKHQSDKLCRDCAFYDLDLYQDSFGQAFEYTCEKDHYEHINYDADACEDFISRQDKRRKNV